MTEQIRWLKDVEAGNWLSLATAARAGLAVPDGFVAMPGVREQDVREAYDELKVREHTHYVAVRGPASGTIEIIGNDQLVHTIRGLWSGSPAAHILVQMMINAAWCGKAAHEGKNVRITAAEGLQCLDPDQYLVNGSTGKCTRRTLYQRPRKVFRGVDGRTRTMQILNGRRPMQAAELEAVVALAKEQNSTITWAMDDRKVWLLSVRELRR